MRELLKEEIPKIFAAAEFIELTSRKALKQLPTNAVGPVTPPGGYVYGLWHPEKGWLYVGVTDYNLKYRWRNHSCLHRALRIGKLSAVLACTSL